jgi:hypothetical protein
MIVREEANHTTVSLFINIPIQPQEALVIEYGGPSFGTTSVWTNRGK